jgi:transmembrane sensor
MSVRQDDDRRSWRVLQAALVPVLFSRPRAITLVRRRAAWIAGTAVVALFLGISIATIRDRSPSIRHVTLDDGSVMHVLSGSDVDIEFSDRRRLVHLPLGEAVFEVAKDPDRPFIVRSKLSDSIAVGTRFGVVTNSSVTTTTVSEGEVRVVTPASADLTTSTDVHAGEEIRVIAGASRPRSVTSVNAERKLSWSAGWLEFDGETIGEAVRTFNRFNDMRIDIAPELSTARLTYYRFSLDQPESFANAIATALNAPVIRSSARNVIYIGDGPKRE